MADESEEDRNREQIELRDELRRLLLRDPFVPIQVLLNSGHQFEIRQAIEATLTKTLLIITPPRGATTYARMTEISGIQVAEHMM
ncbi:MAG TPA: hypothetical protein PKB10_15445 [Tepidisphaeraceae bacterium]|nr:hypothetical protein [Tepidisphaeraceae bacterium]